ncbi:MAG: Rrf2 family transcriptional regulator [Deltaproteobacteria bacterium]|nr:Rrf2 family transcriptional regulator [Deltaproteobacteria bacterium]
MKLTRAGEYAIRCILYLSRQNVADTIRRHDVAGHMDIPMQFLSKIAQQLAKAGLIQITQGAKGGYRLIRSPEEITLLDVIEAVEGELVLNDCLLEHERCSRKGTCAVHQVWAKARGQLRDTLAGVTFAEL